MIRLIKKYYQQYQKFWLYAVGGALAFIVDIGLLYVLTESAGLWYLVSATISVSVAIVVNYTWQRLITFKAKDQTYVKQFGKFILVSLVAIGLNTILMFGLVDRLGLWYLVAKVIVTIILLFFNYFANKNYTFKSVDE